MRRAASLGRAASHPPGCRLSARPGRRYDSWLTVGITDGSQKGAISLIGFDMAAWTVDAELLVRAPPAAHPPAASFPAEQLLQTTSRLGQHTRLPRSMHQRTAASNRGPSARQVDDGAVFWMDPTKAPAGDSVVAQLTVSTGTASRGVFSAQGKSKAGAEDWDICCISFDTGAAGGGGGGGGGGVLIPNLAKAKGSPAARAFCNSYAGTCGYWPVPAGGRDLLDPTNGCTRLFESFVPGAPGDMAGNTQACLQAHLDLVTGTGLPAHPPPRPVHPHTGASYPSPSHGLPTHRPAEAWRAQA